MTTVALSLQAFLIALAAGLIVALLRLSDLVVGSALAVAFLEFIRNMPLLVLLYLFYYVLGPIFALDRYAASVLCLGIYHAALVSEIFRAGIQAVSAGQWEAAPVHRPFHGPDVPLRGPAAIDPVHASAHGGRSGAHREEFRYRQRDRGG